MFPRHPASLLALVAVGCAEVHAQPRRDAGAARRPAPGVRPNIGLVRDAPLRGPLTLREGAVVRVEGGQLDGPVRLRGSTTRAPSLASTAADPPVTVRRASVSVAPDDVAAKAAPVVATTVVRETPAPTMASGARATTEDTSA